LDRLPHAQLVYLASDMKPAAVMNGHNGWRPQWKADSITQVTDEVIVGDLEEHLSLYVCETGACTQSNMDIDRSGEHLR